MRRYYFARRSLEVVGQPAACASLSSDFGEGASYGTNFPEKQCRCFGFTQHKQRAKRTCPALRDRIILHVQLV